MGKSSPPPAPVSPDPAKLAAAQGAANKETAITQYGLNATNQISPQGNLVYEQIGKWPDGTPRYQVTNTLSPEQQGLYNTGVQTQQQLGNIANTQTSKISNLLNQPVDLNNEASQARIDELGRARLDPRFARDEAALRTQLLNSGIGPGTEAYNNAMTQFGQTKNDAYNQLALQGRGQSIQEILAERNQPINEITALMSGSQVSQPNFLNTPTPGVAPTDLIGAYGLQQQAYGNQLNAYNASQAGPRAAMSGLFGLGSAALGGWAMSDRRVKKDIHKVGKLSHGLPIYSYKYKSGGLMQLGLMAQDVEKKIPDAVAETDGGYKAVNYAKVAEALQNG